MCNQSFVLLICKFVVQSSLQVLLKRCLQIESGKREIMPVIVSQCWVATDPENVFLPGWSLEVIIGNYGYLGIIVVLRDLRYHLFSSAFLSFFGRFFCCPRWNGIWRYLCSKQGDQIGLIFAQWAIVYFGLFL
jgi:hypothetical protein